jgi:hypothetical protein
MVHGGEGSMVLISDDEGRERGRGPLNSPFLFPIGNQKACQKSNKIKNVPMFKKFKKYLNN